MCESPFHLPTGFDGVVRLFPLPGHVLFPHVTTPLKVFESRYVEMLEDAIASDQLITMATLLPGFEHDYASRPGISPFVCIGTIAQYKKTEEGHYNMILVGIQRAQIVEEKAPVRSYRQALVTVLNDLPVPAERDAERLASELKKRLLDDSATWKQVLYKSHELQDAPLVSLTDGLAYILPWPTEFRLQLLAEIDSVVRAEMMLANRDMLGEPPSAKPPYSQDFSAN